MKTHISIAFNIILCGLFAFDGQATETFEQRENQRFSGSIRAKGLFGLVAVKGMLSFDSGNLCWTVEQSTDCAPYRTEDENGAHKFYASYLIENDERVEWSGAFNGNSLSHVTALWTRTPGDFIHDLLLPKKVTMKFTPDSPSR